mmetsp:Transcript_21788/g.48807  ORF Transcript_21788/g.48807 Transcript_21788/m.48807 type:complete len:317 (+) Transcript_21788:1630-2580(+)
MPGGPLTRTARAFTFSGAPPPGRKATFFDWPLRTTASQSRSHSESFLTTPALPTRSPKVRGVWLSTQLASSAAPAWRVVAAGTADAATGPAVAAAGPARAAAGPPPAAAVALPALLPLGRSAKSWASLRSSGCFFPFAFRSRYFLYFEVSSTCLPSSKREPTTKYVVFPDTAAPTFPPAALTRSSAACRSTASSSPVKHTTTLSKGNADFVGAGAGGAALAGAAAGATAGTAAGATAGASAGAAAEATEGEGEVEDAEAGVATGRRGRTSALATFTFSAATATFASSSSFLAFSGGTSASAAALAAAAFGGWASAC